jgi:hypothetical protein
MSDENSAMLGQPAPIGTPEMRSARVGRLRAQLRAVDDQIRVAGKPERMSGLLADRERIVCNLRELNDDAFLREYLGEQ